MCLHAHRAVKYDSAYNQWPYGEEIPRLVDNPDLPLHFIDLSSLASFNKVRDLAAWVNLKIPGYSLFTASSVPFMLVIPT